MEASARFTCCLAHVGATCDPAERVENSARSALSPDVALASALSTHATQPSDGSGRDSGAARHAQALGRQNARRAGGVAGGRCVRTAWDARGVFWQRLARGEIRVRWCPGSRKIRSKAMLDLEWPIEGLEPLSFVLGRLFEPLAERLERADRGAAVLHTHLRLVSKEVHARTLQLPAPMRDPKTLRTLVLLDLETNPPSAAIDRVRVLIEPTPARVTQWTLFERAQPSPEQVSTLLARLTALMGESHVGSPRLVDSWKPGAFEMRLVSDRRTRAPTELCTELSTPHRTQHSAPTPHSARRSPPCAASACPFPRACRCGGPSRARHDRSPRRHRRRDRAGRRSLAHVGRVVERRSSHLSHLSHPRTAPHPRTQRT